MFPSCGYTYVIKMAKIKIFALKENAVRDTCDKYWRDCGQK